ncbi:coagulation factor 5/8 type domain protein [Paenibacillus curdlanolyticus YK9]|uniref:glucan endo-1,3-beta-D-glucosidase n=1 Tax=Paenibacillus curdlanolyticus YK9 TaxID=717606 RepID=E0IBK6_9BACL|nr:discoidin domain-containing protein [Paenibacillus curdlanolyticus]EFM10086.1 coagulation factor 5/8 type domain protein [Paenibacillus curdlanolyticus YK9]
MQTGKFKKAAKRLGSYTLVAAMLGTLVSLPVQQRAEAAAGSYLLSQNRTAYASSVEGNNAASLAVDGNTGSRWSSAWGSDGQWMYIDLGANATIDRVKIQWEGAFATGYKIQTSNDEATWTDIYSTTTGDGGIDDVTVSGTGRFVRVLGTARSLAAYGISIFEFEVYGTGGVNQPPVQYGPNVALNKPVTVSSYEQSGYLPPGATLKENAVDGNSSTRWGSNATDNEWIYVDLGNTRTIGRIVLNWESYGRVFDLQVSNNATDWTTVYREIHGSGGKQDIPVYASGRYVRMKGIGRGTSFGYSLFDFEVYDYVAGQPQPVYTIPALPTPAKVNVGSGSYLTNDLTFPQANYPGNKTAAVNTPIPSNDWWQSLLIKPLGDSIITLPLKSKFFKQGLGLLNPGAGWITADGGAVNADGNPDIYLMASNINTSTMKNRVTGYGDFSVNTVLSDTAEDKMKVTFTKGSPYVFTEFSDRNSVELYSSLVAGITDPNGAAILATDGSTYTGDRIAVRVLNTDGRPNPVATNRYYGIFAPPGTVFKKVGAKIKIQLGSSSNYMSVAAMPATSDLDLFYQHAYAFVTGSTATYSYNEGNSDVTTTLGVTTQLKRTGFSDQSMLALYPHQWKKTNNALTTRTYPSVRGTLKLKEGNSFTTVDKFYGMVPTFTEPGNAQYARQQMEDYLSILDQETANNIMNGDAYWQGKTLHPLAMGALEANEIGDITLRNKFLSRIKAVLTDWYTYTEGEPEYFMYYNNDWGTMYYKNSGFGANYGITDHHFTYGYYVFASAILATFDNQWRTEYGGMVEQLIRDYANPSKTDPLYPQFRNFDPYEGHSWAGGYADNDSGNNQEAAGESLFGWVGQYMWSMLTGDTNFRNAAIYGFTTELNAVEQYWFNYDGDNWLPEWTHKSVGQVYGSSNFFGTFFSGLPVHVYGIHWLPTAEYLTSYGLNKNKAAALYNGFVADNGGTPGTDWQHIVWPIRSLSDANGVLSGWNTTNMQRNEIFNTYWFVNSMASLGERTRDVWATGYSSATVYKKNNAYIAQVWNPTSSPVTVTFKNAAGTTGTAVVGPKSLVQVNPMANTNTSDQWTPWDGTNSGGNNGGNNGGGGTQPQPGTNLAKNKTVTVSSTQDAFIGNNATDGDAGTRWSSEQNVDAQTLTVDLGSVQQLTKVKLLWEVAYGKSYKIQLSNDGTTWTDAFSTTTGDGGTDDIAINGSGRYLRVNMSQRGTIYGYSLYEVEAYNDGTTTPPQTETLLSLNKVATSSSVEAAFTPGAAVDADMNTRWASATSAAPEWITVDLGQQRTISRVQLDWETAYGKSYKIQVSNNGTDFADLYSTTTGDGGNDNITVNGSGRYVRVYCTERGTQWGYSLYNFAVYGS